MDESQKKYIEWKSKIQPKEYSMISFPRNVKTGRMNLCYKNQMSSCIWGGMDIYREAQLSGMIEVSSILIEAWDTQMHAVVKTYKTALFKSEPFIVHKSYLNQIFLTKKIQQRAYVWYTVSTQ